MNLKLCITLISSLLLLSSQSALCMEPSEAADTPISKSVGKLCEEIHIDLTKTDYSDARELDIAISNQIIPNMSIKGTEDYNPLMKKIHTTLYPTVEVGCTEKQFMMVVRDIVSDKYNRIRKALDRGNVEEAQKIQRISDKENLSTTDLNTAEDDNRPEEDTTSLDIPSIHLTDAITPKRKLPFAINASPKGTPNTKNLVDILAGVDFRLTKFENINNFVSAISLKVSVEVDMNELMKQISEEMFESVEQVMSRKQLNRSVRDLVPDKYVQMKKALAADDAEKVQRIKDNTEHDKKSKKAPTSLENKQALKWASALFATVIALYGLNHYLGNRPAIAV